MKNTGKLAAVFFALSMLVGLSAAMSLKEPDINASEYIEESSEENVTEEISEKVGTNSQDNTEDIRNEIERKLEEKTAELKREKENSVTGNSHKSKSGFLAALFNIFR